MAIEVANKHTIAINMDWLLCKTRKNEAILDIQRAIVDMFIQLGYALMYISRKSLGCQWIKKLPQQGEELRELNNKGNKTQSPRKSLGCLTQTACASVHANMHASLQS